MIAAAILFRIIAESAALGVFLWAVALWAGILGG